MKIAYSCCIPNTAACSTSAYWTKHNFRNHSRAVLILPDMDTPYHMQYTLNYRINYVNGLVWPPHT